MKRFLENLMITILLWTLFIAILGIAEITDPGFILFGVGVATGAMYSVWQFFRLCHETVVKNMRRLISSSDREYLCLPGPVRNRNETSSSFFRQVSPAKVMKNLHKVKREDLKNINFYIKSGPVRPDLALIPVFSKQEQHNWLSSLSDKEILEWLNFLDRQTNHHFVKFALNELKRRAQIGRIAPSYKVYTTQNRPIVAVDAEVVWQN